MAWFRCTGNTGGSLKVRTASGAIATFETNMADVLQEVKCEINATGGNGTPDSPNPINGITEANITRCGVNLYSNIFSEYRKPVNYYIKNIPLKAGTTYTIKAELKSGGTAQNNVAFGVANKGEQYSEFDNRIMCITIGGTTYTNTFTPTSAWTSPKLICYVSGETEFEDVFDNYEITLVEGSSAIYTPYNGQTYTVTFGQTVYGGVLDVTRGKLTVKYAKKTMSGGDVFGGSNPGRNAQLTISDMKSGEGYSDNNVKCSALVKTNLFEEGVTAIRVGANNNTVYLYNMNLLDLTIVDSATLNTYLSNNPIEFTYELSTPFDIDLTPVQIEALLGINNVWHDANGDTEVKYLEVVRN